MTASANPTPRIVSGMRPTGPLHLGHYFGVLLNWVKMQDEYDCFFFVADWHALTSEYADPRKIKGFVPELVKDWLAAGLDPEKCTLYLQSAIPEHAELHLILSMLTPLGWLERNPTYKDVKEQLAAKDLNTYGFLGYPVLQAADIILYKPVAVPVGQDQLPHLELTREIVRRFNYLYCERDKDDLVIDPFFPEPDAVLTESAKLPGLDGRKMSKSYGNSIYLKDEPKAVRKGVMKMLTDTKRQRLSDPGKPEDCNLYPYLKIFKQQDFLDDVYQGCITAGRGCGDCKKVLAEALGDFLEPMQERRAAYDKDESLVMDILRDGTAKAQAEAKQTMAEVREMLNF